MAYRNTLQADALKLVGKKLQSSLAVEGELPEDGLDAYGDDDDGDDLMLALTRKISSASAATCWAWEDADSTESASSSPETIVDGQRLRPVNGSAKMSARLVAARRCSRTLASGWAAGEHIAADRVAGDAQHAGGGAHRESLQLCLPDGLPACLLPCGGWARRPGPGPGSGTFDGDRGGRGGQESSPASMRDGLICKADVAASCVSPS